MLKRAFNTREKLNEFILKYVHKELNIQLILSILQPHLHAKSTAIKHYSKFWNLSESQNLESKVALFLQDALQDKFGNPDFSLDDRRSQGTYILELEGQQFIVTVFIEVILEGKITDETIDKMIRFKGQLAQLVVDYIIKNYDKLTSHEQRSVDQIKNSTLLDSNGQIKFPQSDSGIKLI